MPSFPKIDLTRFQLPQVPKLPEFPDLPELDLPGAEQITDCARNAVYVSVGLVVTAFETVIDTAKVAAAKVNEVGQVGWLRSAA